jgi:SAM-dependent methyltransferase
VPIGFGQTASQPSLQALYMQLLELRPTDRVLEIGTGSGFQTAVLAQLVDRVYSVERIRELSVRAREALDRLRISNVALLVGDGTIGWSRYAPYDAILVAAAAPEIPEPLWSSSPSAAGCWSRSAGARCSAGARTPRRRRLYGRGRLGRFGWAAGGGIAGSRFGRMSAARIRVAAIRLPLRGGCGSCHDCTFVAARCSAASAGHAPAAGFSDEFATGSPDEAAAAAEPALESDGGAFPDWLAWDTRDSDQAAAEVAAAPPAAWADDVIIGDDLMEMEYAATAVDEGDDEDQPQPLDASDDWATDESEPAARVDAALVDALAGVAERLERLAGTLRERPGELLSGDSTDPLDLLVAGYALGLAQGRSRSPGG